MKKLAMLLLVALMALGMVVPAFADAGDVDEPINVNATIDIEAGVLHVTPLAIQFEAVTLNGLLQDSDGSTGIWEANDPTGAGAGWKVQVSATDFVDGEHNIPVEGFKAFLPADTIVPFDGSVVSPKPTSAIEAGITLSDEAQTMLSAAEGEGMGYYKFQPNFNLSIPADTYAGNYTSVVTVVISAAP